MPGRWTVDAVFVLRKLSKKFRAKNKKLFFVFVDLKKAFDRVPKDGRVKGEAEGCPRIFGEWGYVSL